MRVDKTLKISRVIVCVIIGLYLVLCFGGFYLLKLSGLSYYVIVSGSMQPEINIDDVVVSRNLNETEVSSSLNVGDVATYFDGTAYVTHRVYDKTTDTDGNPVFIFKGDHNNTIDRYSVKVDQIKGKQVFNLPHAAGLFEFLNSTYGTVTLISILLILFVTENTLSYAINSRQSKSPTKSGENHSVDDLTPQTEMS